MNFLNEWEPYPAQWIRNLIEAGELPLGVVDERDIRDVQPADLEGYTQVHLMAGIGGWPYALQLAGWPATQPVWTASLPCQPFSTAGHGRGTDDERHLWPTVAKLIASCRPPIIFGEQVASKAGRSWFDGVSADLEDLDYSCRAVDIPACSVGAPHLRNRIYWVAVDNANSGRREQPDEAVRAGRVSTEPTGSRDMADTQRHRQYGGGGMAEPGGWDESPVRGTDSRDVADTGDDQRGRWGAVPETPAITGGTTGANPDSSGGGSGSSRIRSFDESGYDRSSDRRDLADAKRGGRMDTAAYNGEHAAPGRPEWDATLNVGVTGEGRGDEGSPAGMGNTDGQGLERGADRGDGTREWAVEPSGMGPWGDTIWLECADGKARRIPNPETQPGLHPLAYGLPGKLGRSRAKKLKGFGNAIVPQVAATFIAAVMETLMEDD